MSSPGDRRKGSVEANPAGHEHSMGNPPWSGSARGFIVDLDGTLVRGQEPLAGAVELLDSLAGRFVVVSNNSSDTARSLARRLGRRGLPLPAKRVVLAGENAVRRLAARRDGARVMVLAHRRLRALAARLGLVVTSEAPELLLLCRDEGFDYGTLRRAANVLRRGAELVVANPDAYHPGVEDGEIVPETGALMRALVECSGVHPIEILGKPGPTLFKEALRRLGTTAGEVVVIGDNPGTDARGAVAMGMRYFLVGESGIADAKDLPALLAHRGEPRGRVPDRSQVRDGGVR